ncbi:translocation/assembly module TamB domain-containing protein [Psychrobium sp. nBUS_13]|uniref:translocation/assembly module TamB domain-containing protein n=1 Tax=Psychrobium sp. nBUS_13 TaxID=3395319 RepID=UPI003EBED7FD
MTRLNNTKLRKNSSWGLAFIFCVFLLTLFTHWGNRLVLATVEIFVPTLSISLEQGTLLFAPQFKYIKYRDSHIIINARELSLNWQPQCFLRSSLCLTEGVVSSLNVELVHSSSASTESIRRDEELVINPHNPWPLLIDTLSVNHLTISDDTHDISLNNVSLSGHWQDSDILVKTLSVDQFNIEKHFPNSVDNKTAKPLDFSIDTVKQFQQQIANFEWPKIDGKLNIQHLGVKHIEFISTEKEQIKTYQLSDAAMIATVTKQQVEQLTIDVKINDTPVSMRAAATLNKSLPLRLHVKTALKLPTLDQHDLDLTLEGNLAKLSLKATTSGQLESSLVVDMSPLIENFPLSIAFEWQPLLIKENELDSGTVSLSGDLSSYDFSIKSAISNSFVNHSTVSLQGRGTLHSLSDIQLNVDGEQGTGLFKGNFDWRESITSSGTFNFNQFKVGSLVKQFPALIDGSLSVSAQYNQSAWQLNLPSIKLTGQALKQPFSIDGTIKAASSTHQYGNWQLDNIVLSHGENTIEVNGFVNDDASLTANIDIRNLAQSLPDFISQNMLYNNTTSNDTKRTASANGISKKSTISGQVLAHGNVTALLLDAQLQGKHLSYLPSELTIAETDITLSTQLGLPWINPAFNSSMKVRANGVDYKNLINAGNVNISITGNAEKHSLFAQLQSDNLNTNVSANGALIDDQWKSTISKAQFSYLRSTLALTKNMELLADIASKDITLNAHCWQAKVSSNQSTPSHICLPKRFTLNTSTMRSNLAKLTIENANIEDFQVLIPKAHQVTGPINGFITFQSFNPQALSLATQVTWHDGTITSDINDKLVTHHIDSLEINSAINRNLANVIAKLSSPTLGKIDASMLSNIYQEKPFVSGHINSQGLQLAPYKPFLRYVSQLDGELSVSAGFTVDADSQQVFGTLSSNDITIASEKLPNTIDDLNTSVVFSGTHADLTSQFRLAQGHGDVSGNLDWSDAFLANLVLNGESLKVMPKNGTSITFSPQLALKLTSSLAKIRGNISIDEAQISIESLPESAVAVSPDAVVTSEQKQSSAMAIDLDVNTQLGNALHLQAFGLESLVGGELNLKQNQQQPLSAYGELAISDATYKAFGQHLMLEQGQIIFTGSLNNPVINIKAIRDPKETNDGVIAGVYVNGDANQPALTVFSEPVLEQQQAISYLLRGYGLGTDSKYGQDLAIAMLVNSGLGGASGAVNALGDAVGIDNLNVTTSGSGDQTRLEFSGFIGPKLQLRYGVGVFDALPEVGLRYQVNRRLFVEFINNTDQALDLLYQFSFD